MPQTPFDGASIAPTLATADAPEVRTTQYYEMLGSRAIYHRGWKAVVFHPPAGLVYDGTDAGRRPFDDDIWELYHVAEDFSECHDVAAEHPERLAELQALWWAEAERHQVLPLNNQPGRHGDRRFVRNRYVYRPGISSIPENMAPNLRNRGFRIAASLLVPAAGEPCQGALVAHGGHSGGYALYLAGRRLHYVNNLLGTVLTTVSAEVELPPGPVEVSARFSPTGPFEGELELWYGDVPVGRGRLPQTTPLTYGVDPFAVGYQRMTPIAPELEGRAEVTPGVLVQVVIEADGEPWRNPPAEERAAVATQ